MKDDSENPRNPKALDVESIKEKLGLNKLSYAMENPNSEEFFEIGTVGKLHQVIQQFVNISSTSQKVELWQIIEKLNSRISATPSLKVSDTIWRP